MTTSRFIKSSFLALLLLSGSTLLAQTNDGITSARALLAEGNFRQAIARLESARFGSSLSPQLFYYLGLSYQGIADYEKASIALEQARELDSTSIPILLALARSYENLGIASQAEATYATALTSDSTDLNVLTSVGKFYFDGKRWEKAKPFYEQIVALDSSNVFGILQLARCQANLKQYDDALMGYERAIQYNPRNLSAALELIQVYLNSNRLSLARVTADRALNVFPHHTLLWKRKGDVAFREGAYENAATSYEMTLALGDSSAGLQKMLGVTYHFVGDSLHAEAALKRALELDDGDAAIFFYLGIVERKLGKLRESEIFFAHAARLLTAGLLGDVYAQLAVTYAAQRNVKDAVRYYKQAMVVNPSKTDLLFHLAALYDKHYADRSVAELYYRKFLKLDGNVESNLHSYAQQRLKELEAPNQLQR